MSRILAGVNTRVAGESAALPFLEQFARIRAYLRREVDLRLRELATAEPLELPCPDCGAPVEVSPSYHEKVRRGAAPQPKCYECKRPKQSAQADAEAVRFVEVLDSADELALTVAALR